MKGHGQSRWPVTQRLAAAQERHAIDTLASGSLAPTIYRLYTEDLPNVASIVAKYFKGASLIHVDGLWEGTREAGLIVEIIDEFQYRDKAVRLAADITDTNKQSVVIVTWQSSHGFEKTSVYGRVQPPMSLTEILVAVLVK